jgi:hypothetical protein
VLHSDNNFCPKFGTEADVRARRRRCCNGDNAIDGCDSIRQQKGRSEGCGLG